MNKYIFLTDEGTCLEPVTDEIIENIQVIGFAKGDNPKEAFENLKIENAYLIDTAFNEIYCLKMDSIESETTNFFYLGENE